MAGRLLKLPKVPDLQKTTPEAIKAAKEFLLESCKKGLGLNRWAFVSGTGEVFKDHGPCFSNLSSVSSNRNKIPPGGLLAVSYCGESLKHQNLWNYSYGKDSLEFLKFLLGSDSPWRKEILPFLLEDSPEDVQESKGFLISVQEINYLLLKNFLIASRFCYEFPDSFYVYKELRSKKVRRFKSFVTSQVFYGKDDTFCKRVQSGHHAMSSHTLGNLLERLKSGESNGLYKNFFGSELKNPLKVKTGDKWVPTFYSSPFFTESPEAEALDSLFRSCPTGDITFDTILRYSKALDLSGSDILKMSLPDRLKFYGSFWKSSETSELIKQKKPKPKAKLFIPSDARKEIQEEINW